MSRVTRMLVMGLATGALVAGCDWVDSAGGGGNGGTRSQITLNEQPLGSAVSLLEESSSRVLVAERDGDDSLEYQFSSSPLQEGSLDTCLSLNGFDAERAAATLAEACSTREPDCRFEAIVDDTDPDELAFTLDVPELRAPVGLRHTLITGRETEDEFGQLVFEQESSTDIDFCLISINEAPVVEDDTYVLVEGGVLNIGALAGVLANDSDDDDVGNEPLTVDTTPVSAPASADQFELREDGGFTYRFAVSGIRADVVDRFSYRVSDGSLDTVGEATVRIVASNQAPVLVDGTPDEFVLTVGEPVEEDLSMLFRDPEGLSLEFSFLEALPTDGDLELTADGVLQGIPGDADEGEYLLTLVADDGGRATEATISLVIEAPANRAPVFVEGSVFNQTVDVGDFIDAVRPEFDDAEDDTLRYSSVGAALPTGVNVNPFTGVVSGRARSRGVVNNIVIEAEDSAGNTAESDPFSIRVL